MPSISGTVYINNKGSASFIKKRKRTHPSELDLLVKKSKQVIFQTKSVFPFEILPDSITICTNRVTVTKRSWFYKYEYPMLIESVTGARVFRNLFFATLHIDTFGLRETPEPINYLKIEDARIARRYILALIECKKANLNLNSYNVEEIREKLKEIGKVREGAGTLD